MRYDTCYLHPARLGAVCHMGIWYCDPCWLAYCKKCDDADERAYLRQVWRAKEIMCADDSGPDAVPRSSPDAGEARTSSAQSRRDTPATEPGGAPASAGSRHHFSPSRSADELGRNAGDSVPAEQLSMWGTNEPRRL